jgi:hypothetical protein
MGSLLLAIKIRFLLLSSTSPILCFINLMTSYSELNEDQLEQLDKELSQKLDVERDGNDGAADVEEDQNELREELRDGNIGELRVKIEQKGSSKENGKTDSKNQG